MFSAQGFFNHHFCCVGSFSKILKFVWVESFIWAYICEHDRNPGSVIWSQNFLSSKLMDDRKHLIEWRTWEIPSTKSISRSNKKWKNKTFIQLDKLLKVTYFGFCGFSNQFIKKEYFDVSSLLNFNQQLVLHKRSKEPKSAHIFNLKTSLKMVTKPSKISETWNFSNFFHLTWMIFYHLHPSIFKNNQ